MKGLGCTALLFLALAIGLIAALVSGPGESGQPNTFLVDGASIRQSVTTDIDDLVSYYLSKQVLDPQAINYGSFSGSPCYSVEDNYMEMFNEAPLAMLAYAWSCPESSYYGDSETLESIRLGFSCLCNVQCSTGGFPVGREVLVGGEVQPAGVQLEDYGDDVHQFFLGDCMLYAYSKVRDSLPSDERQRIETALERLFEFCVIEPENYSTRCLVYESIEYPQEQYFREQVTVPRSVLESAARVDIVLRVLKIGDPEPTIWNVSIGEKTLSLETATGINPNDINPYREYGWEPISVASWQVDQVEDILPSARLTADGGAYVFDVVVGRVDCWDEANCYAMVESIYDKEPTWTSVDGEEWQPVEKDLALQVWVYGNNTARVGTRASYANQEAGRFYLIHKSRWLFDIAGDAVLLDVADAAFQQEVAVFARIAKDGIFPECNEAITQATQDTNQVCCGGWSPGHGFLSKYLIGLIAGESENAVVKSLAQKASSALEYLLYEEEEGYCVMNATSARDNNRAVVTGQVTNLLALGFVAASDSPALKSILGAYTPSNLLRAPNISYPLQAHQIDFMPIVTLHESVPDSLTVQQLPVQEEHRFIKNFARARLLVVKTANYLYYISYGGATPSGGCIAERFNLDTKQHEVTARGACLEYGEPLFELKSPGGSSSVWDTQTDIEIVSGEYPYEVVFTGYLKYPDQIPTDQFRIEYRFFDDRVAGLKCILMPSGTA